MLIRCPTCASAYDLAPELLPEGRILRCAHCRDAWAHSSSLVVRGESTLAGGLAAPAFAQPLGPVSRRLAAIRWGLTSRGRSPILAALSGALAVVLVGGSMAAVAAKARVVAIFPPSQAVFTTIGLPVNLRGLGIEGVTSTIDSTEGAAFLRVEGRITNLRAGPTPLPALRIAVRDRNGRELYYWTIAAPKPDLAQGETVAFLSRFSAPPRDGHDLAVSFLAEPAGGAHRVVEARQGGG